MAKLIFTNEIFSGRVYELALEKTTVGRGDQNTLVIRDSSLSLIHCEILMHGSEIIVRDLNSSNGTFVNDSRLNMQSQVKSGQTVRFGSVEARLELDPAQGKTEDTEITAIYTLDRVMRERRAQSRAGPPPIPMPPEPGLHVPTGDHTTVLVKADLPPTASAGPAIAGNESPTKGLCPGKLARLRGLELPKPVTHCKSRHRS